MAGRQHPDTFDEETLVLIFIAAKIREAQRAESVLTSAGIDYWLQEEEFKQGFLTFSTRLGVGFYVYEGEAMLARDELANAHLQRGIIS